METAHIDHLAAEATRAARDHAAAFLDAGRRPGANLAAVCANIITGYHVGDPEIMDYCPAPLSGEWAGESMYDVLDLPTDTDADTLAEAADTYEEAYTSAWWDALLTECARHLLAHLTPGAHITARGCDIHPAHNTARIILRDTHSGDTTEYSAN